MPPRKRLRSSGCPRIHGVGDVLGGRSALATTHDPRYGQVAAHFRLPRATSRASYLPRPFRPAWRSTLATVVWPRPRAVVFTELAETLVTVLAGSGNAGATPASTKRRNASRQREAPSPARDADRRKDDSCPGTRAAQPARAILQSAAWQVGRRRPSSRTRGEAVIARQFGNGRTARLSVDISASPRFLRSASRPHHGVGVGSRCRHRERRGPPSNAPARLMHVDDRYAAIVGTRSAGQIWATSVNASK